jgi:uncharacterized protein
VSGLLPILLSDADPEADPSVVVAPESSWAPKLERLRARFRDGRRWVVCFSGGVDSAFVLLVARAERGDDVLALTAVSDTLPDEEREDCVRLAESLGARHLLVESHEIDDPDYAANPRNRCYFCKSELYAIAAGQARNLGFDVVADGVNADDLRDFRPGLQAADEAAIVHPLVEAGMGKADVRGAALSLGLDVWSKPAYACLSSRFPHGVAITPERLRRVAQVERTLRGLGFRQFRVRYHEEICRIELRPEEIGRLASEPARSAVAASARDAGFRFVTLDLEGYRSGVFNPRPGDGGT